MKKHIIILVFLLANLSFSQSYNYSQSKEYIISGTISSSDDDELLEYATITLLNPDDNSVLTGGITDNLGRFSISAKDLRSLSSVSFNFSSIDIVLVLTSSLEVFSSFSGFGYW